MEPLHYACSKNITYVIFVVPRIHFRENRALVIVLQSMTFRGFEMPLEIVFSGFENWSRLKPTRLLKHYCCHQGFFWGIAAVKGFPVFTG